MENYEILYGSVCTRIDIHQPGYSVRTVYVHRSEYRNWEA